jgi:hypothetical protein
MLRSRMSMPNAPSSAGLSDTDELFPLQRAYEVEEVIIKPAGVRGFLVRINPWIFAACIQCNRWKPRRPQTLSDALKETTVRPHRRRDA